MNTDQRIVCKTVSVSRETKPDKNPHIGTRLIAKILKFSLGDLKKDNVQYIHYQSTPGCEFHVSVFE